MTSMWNKENDWTDFFTSIWKRRYLRKLLISFDSIDLFKKCKKYRKANYQTHLNHYDSCRSYREPICTLRPKLHKNAKISTEKACSQSLQRQNPSTFPFIIGISPSAFIKNLSHPIRMSISMFLWLKRPLNRKWYAILTCENDATVKSSKPFSNKISQRTIFHSRTSESCNVCLAVK